MLHFPLREQRPDLDDFETLTEDGIKSVEHTLVLP